MVGEIGVNGCLSFRFLEKVLGVDFYRWNKSFSCILLGVYL